MNLPRKAAPSGFDQVGNRYRKRHDDAEFDDMFLHVRRREENQP
jgi:hypothetical protein